MKYLLTFFIATVTVVLFYLNFSLYYKPQFVIKDNQTINQDVYKQLQFLKTSLHKGSGKEMQGLFPEGFVFIHAIYGLSWHELIYNLETESSVYLEGITQIRYALQQINSAYGKHSFNKNLPLEYGAFYRGWGNYLLGKLLEIQTKNKRDVKEQELFLSICNDIAEAIKKSKTPYLESYYGQTWPADNMICIASLHLHDQLFPASYELEIKKWLLKVKERLDIMGLIPHEVDSKTGYPIQNAKGNSQSLMLNFLFDIDAGFAKQQYEIYDSIFKETRFGLPGIRQYPKKLKVLVILILGQLLWELEELPL